MMRNIFKRRRPPQPAPVQISAQDRLIAAHSGYTPEQWDKLPANVKADKREQVAWELRQAS